MNWLLENWLGVIGALGVPLAYIFGGKQAQKQALKKGDVEIKQDELDYAKAERAYFIEGIDDKKAEISELKAEKESIKEEAKAEREYFRNQVDAVRATTDSLQKQLNDLNTSYSLEVEKSQFWMTKFDELSKKYEDINKKYDELAKKYSEENKDYIKLKELYDKLKRDFDKLKKENV